MQPGQIPKKEVKDIMIGAEARDKIINGVLKGYEVVSTTYGPSGMNVILGLPFGDPTVTRDGVTVAKRVVLKDQAEDDAWQIIRQASEKTNRSVGDGTTSTVAFASHLVINGMRLIAAGENGMLLRKQIIEDSQKVIEFLKSKSKKATDELLLNVATVSAGDPAIGALIADTVKDVGTQGGISIREQSYPTIDVEKVNGYYFDKGFFALNQQVEYAKPLIFVTQKQIASNNDIIPLLARVIDEKNPNKNLVIIGDVRGNSDAMNTLILNVVQGKLNAVVIPPPAYGDESIHFLDDIATYVGSKPFMAGDDINQLTDEHFGSAERVQVNQDRAIMFKGAGTTEMITDRAAVIKGNIDKETSAHRKDQLEQRYSKLTGKIAIVNVGGSTQAEMEELRYRVEDAIEATKSAAVDGVLPGGGNMLVRAMDLPISQLFKDSLRDTFYKLMSNAAESGEYRLKQISSSKFGHGFNLREMTNEPIDLMAAGIFDATQSQTQTIENAVSAAGTLLTGGAIVDPAKEDQDD